MYKIPLIGLKVGTHEFDYKLDNQFFDEFEELEGTIGELNAHVVLIKSESLMTLNLKLTGAIEALCDRCLDTFNMAFEAETKLLVKFSDESEEQVDDLIVISFKEDHLDLKDLFYELYFLNIPLQAIHPDVDGESTCNENMLERLDEYSVDPVKKIDPRWEELKKLINNK